MTNSVALLNSESSVWQLVLDRAHIECNDYLGLEILDMVGYEGFFDGYAQITVPDEFRRDWVNAHYAGVLRTAFSEVLGESFVDFKISIAASEKSVQVMSTPAAPKLPPVHTARVAAKKRTPVSSFLCMPAILSRTLSKATATLPLVKLASPWPKSRAIRP